MQHKDVISLTSLLQYHGCLALSEQVFIEPLLDRGYIVAVPDCKSASRPDVNSAPSSLTPNSADTIRRRIPNRRVSNFPCMHLWQSVLTSPPAPPLPGDVATASVLDCNQVKLPWTVYAPC